MLGCRELEAPSEWRSAPASRGGAPAPADPPAAKTSPASRVHLNRRDRPGILEAPALPLHPLNDVPRTGLEAYDAEIRYIDEQLERLFREIGRVPFSVITADHGEGLDSEAWWGHARNIYNEQVRVPLLLRWPDGRFAETDVDDVAELTDLLPTVLRAAGIDATEIAAHGRLPIEGEPLQRLLRRESHRFGAAFIERRSFDARSAGSPKFEAGEKFALLDGKWKYIYRTAGEDELFRVADDFLELEDRRAANPEVRRRLRERTLERRTSRLRGP